MKEKVCFWFALLISIGIQAQEDLENILAVGLNDANKFVNSYMQPAAEGLIYNASNGWIQEAQVKKMLGFDISIVANTSFISNKERYFTLNTAGYESLQFKDGSTSKEVGTILGDNKDDIIITTEVIDKNGHTKTIEFTLPQGLSSTAINFLPTAFLQGRIGVFKATEVKLRYFPKLTVEDVSLGVFGVGLQHEVSQWFPKEFPIAISVFAAYNNLNADYTFEDKTIVEGLNTQFKIKQNSMVYQLQLSTKLDIINFYGGLGYVSGKSNFDVLGTYEVVEGTPTSDPQNIYVDPISLEHKVSGIRGTIGAKVKLNFFKVHVDYNMSQFNTLAIGLHFGSRN